MDGGGAVQMWADHADGLWRARLSTYGTKDMLEAIFVKNDFVKRETLSAATEVLKERGLPVDLVLAVDDQSYRTRDVCGGDWGDDWWARHESIFRGRVKCRFLRAPTTEELQTMYSTDLNTVTRDRVVNVWKMSSSYRYHLHYTVVEVGIGVQDDTCHAIAFLSWEGNDAPPLRMSIPGSIHLPVMNWLDNNLRRTLTLRVEDARTRRPLCVATGKVDSLFSFGIKEGTPD